METTENTTCPPCSHCGYIFNRGRIVTYWRNASALWDAGLVTAYLCGKCADSKEVK